MKTIGLLGGMSWESTMTYYQQLNSGVKKALGGLHSAKIVLNSVDFQPISEMQHEGDWAGTAKILCEAAQGLEKAKADCVLICTNTMHYVADEVANSVDIPLIHLADATAEHIVSNNQKTVGLLGTAFTMEQDFYKGRLQNKYGLNVLVPEKEDRELVHKIIYEELCLGHINDSAKQEYLRIINDLALKGAESIILGCTEIGLLVKQQDTQIELCDTTEIHIKKALEFALEKF
ncbi:MAG: aspartate/glutamate racemase family protein [Gammaproteobacteria bacterium]|nr:aspartate/glutamate racemase family protein [Gammaproteobacteria bacterium]